MRLQLLAGGVNVVHGISQVTEIASPGVDLGGRRIIKKKSKHSLQVELNKRLYTDATGRGKGAGYDKLAKDLQQLTAVLAEFSKSKIKK